MAEERDILCSGLEKHYEDLYNSSRSQIATGDYEPDYMIDSPRDGRRGITLLIRPPREVKEKIIGFLNEMKSIEPRQYYYPPSDFHITVLSLIACYEGFTLEKINPADYITVLHEALRKIPPFIVEFRGITASPSCVLLQGYPENKTLNELRGRIRDSFYRSTLPHSIDSRYEIRTAHSTVVRLRETLADREGFLATMDRYRDFSFGSFRVDSLELVGNDWYQRAEHTVSLEEFSLTAEDVGG